MRLDKFLKVSRLIKRRTLAKSLCDYGIEHGDENNYVKVNNKLVKSSYSVKIDDEIEVAFGKKITKVKVIGLKDTVKKEQVNELYDLVEVKDRVLKKDES